MFTGSREGILALELERNIRSIAGKVQTSNPSANKSTPLQNPNQGIATLIVMIAVLTIIILFCCFSAPGIRSLCKRYIFRSCPYDDPSSDNASTSARDTSTPTVILLPHGRMLVVDRNVFNHLQVDHSGLDLLELSANIIRHHQQVTGSTPSILGSDTTSKGLSPTSLDHGPPLYEDIFGDLPPSYSEVSLAMKNQKNEGCVVVEMGVISEQGGGDRGREGDMDGEEEENRV